MKDSLIYPVADMLAMTMHEVDDRVRGASSRTIGVGGWKFEAEMVALSDVQEANRCSYFVRLHANIWLYVVVNDDPESQTDTLLYVFDSKVFDLRVKDASKFGTGSIEGTIKKLAPGITSAFSYKSNDWKAFDVTDLVTTVEV